LLGSPSAPSQGTTRNTNAASRYRIYRKIAIILGLGKESRWMLDYVCGVGETFRWLFSGALGEFSSSGRERPTAHRLTMLLPNNILGIATSEVRNEDYADSLALLQRHY
jgi:hypothetical protein